MPKIMIFRRNKDTQTSCSFRDGIRDWKLKSVGKGNFFEETFESIEEAKLFCCGQLHKNRADFFFLLESDVIIDFVLDKEFMRAQEEMAEISRCRCSFILFSSVGMLISLGLFPVDNIIEHVVFIYGIGFLYVCLHSFMGRGNYEGALIMTLILIFLALSIPPITKMRVEAQSMQQHER